MRRLARLLFVAVGVPNLISFAVVVWLGALAVRLAPKISHSFVVGVVDFSSGFLSVVAGASLARGIGLRVTGWLAVMSAVWLTVHFLRLHKTAPLLRALAGTALGWWLIACPKRGSFGF